MAKKVKQQGTGVVRVKRTVAAKDSPKPKPATPAPRRVRTVGPIKPKPAPASPPPPATTTAANSSSIAVAPTATVSSAGPRLSDEGQRSLAFWLSNPPPTLNIPTENRMIAAGRLWAELLRRVGPIEGVLEVGAGYGVQLRAIKANGFSGRMFYTEPNPVLWDVVFGLNIAQGVISDPPVVQTLDSSFDLVFTRGVLTHVSPTDLGAHLDELVRVSRSVVLLGEWDIHHKNPYTFPCWGREYTQDLEERGLKVERFGLHDMTWWLGRK